MRQRAIGWGGGGGWELVQRTRSAHADALHHTHPRESESRAVWAVRRAGIRVRVSWIVPVHYPALSLSPPFSLLLEVPIPLLLLPFPPSLDAFTQTYRFYRSDFSAMLEPGWHSRTRKVTVTTWTAAETRAAVAAAAAARKSRDAAAAWEDSNFGRTLCPSCTGRSQWHEPDHQWTGLL